MQTLLGRIQQQIDVGIPCQSTPSLPLSLVIGRALVVDIGLLLLLLRRLHDHTEVQKLFEFVLARSTVHRHVLLPGLHLEVLGGVVH